MTNDERTASTEDVVVAGNTLVTGPGAAFIDVKPDPLASLEEVRVEGNILMGQPNVSDDWE